MKQKIRRILSAGKIYTFQYDIGEEFLAEEWYQKQLAKTTFVNVNGRRVEHPFIDQSHTVENIDNPDYIAPEILAEEERLRIADIKFKKLTLSALEDINNAQANLFSAETKALYQELKALLR